MKKAKIRVSSFLAKACSVGLALLGFTSCGDENVPLMYGSPTGQYQVNGMVTDVDNRPLENVVVEVKGYNRRGNHLLESKKDTTDANGAYSVKSGNFSVQRITVVARPEKETSLATDSAQVFLKYNSVPGGNSFGEYKAESTVDIKLKEN